MKIEYTEETSQRPFNLEQDRKELNEPNEPQDQTRSNSMDTTKKEETADKAASIASKNARTSIFHFAPSDSDDEVVHKPVRRTARKASLDTIRSVSQKVKSGKLSSASSSKTEIYKENSKDLTGETSFRNTSSVSISIGEQSSAEGSKNSKESERNAMRERTNTNSSKLSQSSANSHSSNDDSLHRKIGKLAFWKTSSNSSTSTFDQKNLSSTNLGPPISIPPSARSSTSSVVNEGEGTSSFEMNTVPFPTKREASSSSFSDISRFFFDTDPRNRRRKTDESDNRSRSSSMGMTYTSYAQLKRQAAGGVQMNEPLSGSIPNPMLPHNAHTLTSDHAQVNPAPPASSNQTQNQNNQTQNAAPTLQRPATLLPTLSSEDVRNRRVLPLPPPPTIGMGTVLEDPDVRALHLDPMAVRHADHLHMLGYTRNRHVCALLAKESNKEKARYNSMVMQAFIMRMMHFHGEPLDMSLRKYLYRMALAQESQQIERQLQCFSILWNYHNPGIFIDDEHVLCVVYSLVMLHTATFNKNVRQKMSKADFVRNSPLEGLVSEIFEYFYDNITALPFKSEDENMPSTPGYHQAYTHPQSGHTHSLSNGHLNNFTPLSTGSMNPWASPTLASAAKSPNISAQQDLLNDDLMAPPQLGHVALLDSPGSSSQDEVHSTGSRRSPSFIWQKEQATDPYPYILENRLEELRSTLPTFNATPTLDFCAVTSKQELDKIRMELEKDSTLSLQITSGRSKTNHPPQQETEPEEAKEMPPVMPATQGARPSVVDIVVVKYGVVLRREYKRTLGVGEPKPGWREWALVLTTSKLYFFKSTSWIRQLASGEVHKLHVSLETLQSARTMSTRDIAALVKVVPAPTPETSRSSSISGNYNPAVNPVGNGGQRRRASSPAGQSGMPHLAAGPRGTEVFDFMLIDGGRDSAQQYFAVNTEEELRSWVQSINVIATQSSLNIGLLPSWPATAEQIQQALDDVREEIEKAQESVEEYRRTLEHFLMLTPLLPRTREQLVFTAGRYTSRLDDSLAEVTRLRAYENILENVSIH